MTKAKTRKQVAKEMIANVAPFTDREKELTELVNSAVQKTGVGLVPRLIRSDAKDEAVIATVDLLAPKKENVPAVQPEKV